MYVKYHKKHVIDEPKPEYIYNTERYKSNFTQLMMFIESKSMNG